jgi:hypothetical protein
VDASSTQPSVRDGHADGLVARALVALGGADNLWRVHRRLAEGTIEIFGGLRGAYRCWAAAPNRLLEEWTVAGVRHRIGFDGITAWAHDGIRNTPRILIGSARDSLAWRARFPLFLPAVRSGIAITSVRGEADTLRYTAPDGSPESLTLDTITALPRSVSWGSEHTIIEYDDWRRVDGVMLPHDIRTRSPDQEYTVRIDRYRHDATESVSFQYPLPGWRDARIALSLSTLPTRIYKVPDGLLPGQVIRFWGIANPPMERWLVHVLVRETHGRPLEPVGATVGLFSGEQEVKTEVYRPAALSALRRFPASRFAPRDELFHFRHRLTEPMANAIDRMRYTLTAFGQNREPVQTSLDIPLSVYQPRTQLRCPLSGPFLIAVGHEPQELSHTYEWSQQFACDLVPLDSQFSPVSLSGPPAAVLAPADGVVVRARDDIPDDMEPSAYLALDDPLYAIGGNGVVLDHGTGEYSMLFHLRHGSVRVRAGDRVRQGSVLGMVGSAGTPGYLHLHYHLQAGPDFWAADGLPIRFDNVVMASDWLGPFRRGVPVPVPVRGPYLTTTPN